MRRFLLLVPFLLMACAQQASVEAETGVVRYPSEVFLDLKSASSQGASGFLELSYLDEGARQYRVEETPQGVMVEHASAPRVLGCGARPDCGRKAERLPIRLSTTALEVAKQEGITLTLRASKNRQETVFVPAADVRYATRRAQR